MNNPRPFGNWQRDLIGIILFTAGIIIFAAAVPALVAGTTALVMASEGSHSEHLLLLTPSVAQAIVGILLALMSWAIAKQVDPGAK